MRGFRRGGHRLDGPQKAIVAALRKATVVVNLSQGSAAGCPDLVARHRQGHPVWLEVKSVGGDLSPAQVAFAAQWPGGYCVTVRTVTEALAAVGLGITIAPTAGPPLPRHHGVPHPLTKLEECGGTLTCPCGSATASHDKPGARIEPSVTCAVCRMPVALWTWTL